MSAQNQNRMAAAARTGEARFNKGARGAACASSERALREAVPHTSLDGIATYNRRGKMTLAGAEFATGAGHDDPAELPGRHWKTLYDKQTYDPSRKVIVTQVEASGGWRGEVVARRAGGSPYHQEVSP
ncbi:MAG TPA: hypothetical protein VK421_08725, partial [Pyrinomonadaceae bacterium]|nr:hypothetical protein [Pyrinomonadaceae bacterium]